MKSKLNKLLALIMAMAMCLSMLQTAAFAASPNSVTPSDEGYVYTNADGVDSALVKWEDAVKNGTVKVYAQSPNDEPNCKDDVWVSYMFVGSLAEVAGGKEPHTVILKNKLNHVYEDASIPANCHSPEMKGQVCSLCGAERAPFSANGAADTNKHDSEIKTGYIMGATTDPQVKQTLNAVVTGTVTFDTKAPTDSCASGTYYEVTYCEADDGTNKGVDVVNLAKSVKGCNTILTVKKHTVPASAHKMIPAASLTEKGYAKINAVDGKLVNTTAKPTKDTTAGGKYATFEAALEAVVPDYEKNGAKLYADAAKKKTYALCSDKYVYYQVFECEVCGDVDFKLVTGAYPGAKHNDASNVTEYNVVKKPTCTEDGLAQRVTKCDGKKADTNGGVCGHVVKTEDITLKSAGHKWGTPAMENYVAPVCNKQNGSYDLVKTCTVCGLKGEPEHHIIKFESAAHKWEYAIFWGNDANCKATDHTVELVNKEKPTAIITKKCSVCGSYEAAAKNGTVAVGQTDATTGHVKPLTATDVANYGAANVDEDITAFVAAKGVCAPGSKTFKASGVTTDKKNVTETKEFSYGFLATEDGHKLANHKQSATPVVDENGNFNYNCENCDMLMLSLPLGTKPEEKPEEPKPEEPEHKHSFTSARTEEVKATETKAGSKTIYGICECGEEKVLSKETIPATGKKEEAKKTSIAKATISGTATYTGKAQTIKVTVKLNGKTLKEGTDYKFINSQKNKFTAAGMPQVVIQGIGNYTDTASGRLTIKKATKAQTIKAKVASKTYKAADVKKAAKSFSIGVTGAKGTVSYKSSNTKYVTVNKNGKVTVKKGAKKGTYKVTVKAAKASDKNVNYKASTITVQVVVK